METFHLTTSYAQSGTCKVSVHGKPKNIAGPGIYLFGNSRFKEFDTIAHQCSDAHSGCNIDFGCKLKFGKLYGMKLNIGYMFFVKLNVYILKFIDFTKTKSFIDQFTNLGVLNSDVIHLFLY